MKELNLTANAIAGGTVQATVIDAESGKIVREYAPQKNLILDTGLDYFFQDGTSTSYDRIQEAVAGTGTDPNYVAVAGTWAQAANTITRSSGAGVFAVGDIGKRVKFSTNEIGKITAFTSSTEVDVDTSQTVAATTINKWNTDRVGLDTETAQTTTKSTADGANFATLETGTNAVVEKKTWIFDVHTGGSTSYTEVGFTYTGSNNLFSRILLAAPIAIDDGQQLRLAYTLTMTDTAGIVSFEEDLTISGWPYPYDITSITSTGSNFTITTSAAHHYLAAGVINVAGALPTKATITGIASTAGDFTVTTGTAHGHLATDSVEIEGCTVSAYNGTFTVLSVGSTTEYTVTSVLNPGAASDGTSRASVPGSWYDGEWTIASVTSTTIVVTSGINPIAAGDDGTVVNNLTVDTVHPHHAWRGLQASGGSSGYADYLFTGLSMSAALRQVGSELAFTTFPETTTIGGTLTTDDDATKVAGDGKCTNICTFSIDQANETDLGQLLLAIGGSSRRMASIIMDFQQPQRKDDTHQLKITLVRQINASLVA